MLRLRRVLHSLPRAQRHLIASLSTKPPVGSWAHAGLAERDGDVFEAGLSLDEAGAQIRKSLARCDSVEEVLELIGQLPPSWETPAVLEAVFHRLVGRVGVDAAPESVSDSVIDSLDRELLVATGGVRGSREEVWNSLHRDRRFLRLFSSLSSFPSTSFSATTLTNFVLHIPPSVKSLSALREKALVELGKRVEDGEVKLKSGVWLKLAKSEEDVIVNALRVTKLNWEPWDEEVRKELSVLEPRLQERLQSSVGGGGEGDAGRSLVVEELRRISALVERGLRGEEDVQEVVKAWKECEWGDEAGGIGKRVNALEEAARLEASSALLSLPGSSPSSAHLASLILSHYSHSPIPLPPLLLHEAVERVIATEPTEERLRVAAGAVERVWEGVGSGRMELSGWSGKELEGLFRVVGGLAEWSNGGEGAVDGAVEVWRELVGEVGRRMRRKPKESKVGKGGTLGEEEGERVVGAMLIAKRNAEEYRTFGGDVLIGDEGVERDVKASVRAMATRVGKKAEQKKGWRGWGRVVGLMDVVDMEGVDGEEVWGEVLPVLVRALLRAPTLPTPDAIVSLAGLCFSHANQLEHVEGGSGDAVGWGVLGKVDGEFLPQVASFPLARLVAAMPESSTKNSLLGELEKRLKATLALQEDDVTFEKHHFEALVGALAKSSISASSTATTTAFDPQSAVHHLRKLQAQSFVGLDAAAWILNAVSNSTPPSPHSHLVDMCINHIAQHSPSHASTAAAFLNAVTTFATSGAFPPSSPSSIPHYHLATTTATLFPYASLPNPPLPLHTQQHQHQDLRLIPLSHAFNSFPQLPPLSPQLTSLLSSTPIIPTPFTFLATQPSTTLPSTTSTSRAIPTSLLPRLCSLPTIPDPLLDHIHTTLTSSHSTIPINTLISSTASLPTPLPQSLCDALSTSILERAEHLTPTQAIDVATSLSNSLAPSPSPTTLSVLATCLDGLTSPAALSLTPPSSTTNLLASLLNHLHPTPNPHIPLHTTLAFVGAVSATSSSLSLTSLSSTNPLSSLQAAASLTHAITTLAVPLFDSLFGTHPSDKAVGVLADAWERGEEVRGVMVDEDEDEEREGGEDGEEDVESEGEEEVLTRMAKEEDVWEGMTEAEKRQWEEIVGDPEAAMEKLIFESRKESDNEEEEGYGEEEGEEGVEEEEEEEEEIWEGRSAREVQEALTAVRPFPADQAWPLGLRSAVLAAVFDTYTALAVGAAASSFVDGVAAIGKDRIEMWKEEAPEMEEIDLDLLLRADAVLTGKVREEEVDGLSDVLTHVRMELGHREQQSQQITAEESGGDSHMSVSAAAHFADASALFLAPSKEDGFPRGEWAAREVEQGLEVMKESGEVDVTAVLGVASALRHCNQHIPLSIRSQVLSKLGGVVAQAVAQGTESSLATSSPTPQYASDAALAMAGSVFTSHGEEEEWEFRPSLGVTIAVAGEVAKRSAFAAPPSVADKPMLDSKTIAAAIEIAMHTTAGHRSEQRSRGDGEGGISDQEQQAAALVAFRGDDGISLIPSLLDSLTSSAKTTWFRAEADSTILDFANNVHEGDGEGEDVKAFLQAATTSASRRGGGEEGESGGGGEKEEEEEEEELTLLASSAAYVYQSAISLLPCTLMHLKDEATELAKGSAGANQAPTEALGRVSVAGLLSLTSTLYNVHTLSTSIAPTEPLPKPLLPSITLTASLLALHLRAAAASPTYYHSDDKATVAHGRTLHTLGLTSLELYKASASLHAVQEDLTLERQDLQAIETAKLLTHAAAEAAQAFEIDQKMN